ncbi:MAG: hypothetical protein ACQEUT_12375 [Bacillota bacterium]
MKNSKVLLTLIIGLLTILGFLVFNNQSSEARGIKGKESKEVEQFSETLNKANIFAKIGYRLHEKGYEFGLEYDVLSEKKIEVIVKLPQEKIMEETNKEIKQLANEVINENNFDQDIFRIQVNTYIDSN